MINAVATAMEVRSRLGHSVRAKAERIKVWTVRKGSFGVEAAMPRPYSNDLRSRVLQACDAGERPGRVAKRFRVGRASVYLVPLTKPALDVVPADERSGNEREGEMDVGPALVADGQAAKASEPGQRALNHPPVATQALAAFNASASDARGAGSPAQGSAATAIVVGFIAVQLGRSPARPPGALADRWHGIDQRLQVQTVMAVGRAQADGQGDAGAIGEDVALGARPTTIRRVWADLVAPVLAGMAALSSAARLPSMALAIPSRSRQHPVQSCPHAGLLPVPETPPTGHARPAAHLERQAFPRDAGPQHEHDAGQGTAIVQARPTALRLRRFRRQQRRDHRPQTIWKKWFRHPPSTGRIHWRSRFC